MRIFLFTYFFLFITGFGFCQNTKIAKKEDDLILVKEELNKKYDLTAIFYGIDFKISEDGKEKVKIITYILFRNNKTGKEIRYKPVAVNDKESSDINSIVTPNFYFTDIWSPNEEYVVLPIGKFEGFAIFESKNLLENIKANKTFDTIKVKSENSGWFYHDFEKWEDDSTFSFRAGLDGDMFAFKYNAVKSELYCYEGNCAESDIGENSNGKVKVAKKGDIAPTKLH